MPTPVNAVQIRALLIRSKNKEGWETKIRQEKEENPNVPTCCLTCGNYKPMFFTVYGKQCAVFGTVPPGNWDRCGTWTKRLDAPKTGG